MLDVDAEVRNAWGARATQLRAVNDVETRRAYSLASASPDNPGRLILNVRLMMPGGDATDAVAGTGSTYLWGLRSSGSLDIFGPLGSFHAGPGESDMVVIGGGAGMAPLRAIIRDQLLHRQSTRRIDYWYGARTRADLFYVEELDELQAKHENFAWQPVLSEPLGSDGWDRPKGLVHEAIHEGYLRHHPDPGACEFFVCGPPLMLEATRRMLASLGVPAQRILFDDFGT